MFRKTVSGMTIALLAVGILALSSNIQPTKASGTIYIRADGSIDPSTANVTSLDNITYTLTDNIYDSIVVERDNIVIDGLGHMVQGTLVVGSRGIDLAGRFNITIENTEITTFHYGIWLEGSHNNTISGNYIAGNQWDAIFIVDSSGNIIIENTLTASPYAGMFVSGSPNNLISRNNITANSDNGISFYGASSNNVISENTITDNGIGLYFYNDAVDNLVYHNEFANNMNAYSASVNFWDDGYPSGGNYWSDCYSADSFSGPYQNETGIDGMGDTAYTMYVSGNRDNYPLMKPYAGLHDIGIKDLLTSKAGCLPIPTVGQSYSLNITITILNYGLSSETFDLLVYANGSNIETVKNITVAERHSIMQNVVLNTGAYSYGNCIICAYAEPVAGEEDTTDNTRYDLVVITLPGDINGDFVVDIYDALLLAGHFNEHVPWPYPEIDPNVDINNDGVIDIYDAIVLAGHFNEHYP